MDDIMGEYTAERMLSAAANNVTEPAICEVGGTPGMTGIPWGGDYEAENLGLYPRALVYTAALLWLFMGVSVAADLFMEAIEAVTSVRKNTMVTAKNQNGDDVQRIVTYKVWNGTIANLTLMALGSSAPEILLSIIELMGNDYKAGELGPSTIVGSAAFNLLVISACCVYAIPSGEIRKIAGIDAYCCTAFFSVFAYIWLLVVLQIWSPDVVELPEAAITFAFFPLLVILAYLADLGIFRPTEYLQKLLGSKGDDDDGIDISGMRTKAAETADKEVLKIKKLLQDSGVLDTLSEESPEDAANYAMHFFQRQGVAFKELRPNEVYDVIVQMRHKLDEDDHVDMAPHGMDDANSHPQSEVKARRQSRAQLRSQATKLLTAKKLHIDEIKGSMLRERLALSKNVDIALSESATQRIAEFHSLAKDTHTEAADRRLMVFKNKPTFVPHRHQVPDHRNRVLFEMGAATDFLVVPEGVKTSIQVPLVRQIHCGSTRMKLPHLNFESEVSSGVCVSSTKSFSGDLWCKPMDGEAVEFPPPAEDNYHGRVAFCTLQLNGNQQSGDYLDVTIDDPFMGQVEADDQYMMPMPIGGTVAKKGMPAAPVAVRETQTVTKKVVCKRGSLGFGYKGFKITSVEPAGWAASSGLQVGDNIVEIAGQPTAGMDGKAFLGFLTKTRPLNLTVSQKKEVRHGAQDETRYYSQGDDDDWDGEYDGGEGEADGHYIEEGDHDQDYDQVYDQDYDQDYDGAEQDYEDGQGGYTDQDSYDQAGGEGEQNYEDDEGDYGQDQEDGYYGNDSYDEQEGAHNAAARSSSSEQGSSTEYGTPVSTSQIALREPSQMKICNKKGANTNRTGASTAKITGRSMEGAHMMSPVNNPPDASNDGAAEISLPGGLHCTGVVNNNPLCRVYVVPQSEYALASGEIIFFSEQLFVPGSSQPQEIICYALRVHGSAGACRVKWHTEKATALPQIDYEPVEEGVIEFQEGQTVASFRVSLTGRHPYDSVTDYFYVIMDHIELTSRDWELPWPKFDSETDGGADANVMTVFLLPRSNPEEGPGAVMSGVDVCCNTGLLVQAWYAYGAQFRDALYPGGSPEAAEHSGGSSSLVHYIMLPWKLLMAFTPPTVLFGGWLSFVWILIVIGVMTSFVADVASVFGCVLGIEDSITAITFVALGTSVPDLLASKQAACEQETADDCIGNVTGSNSVNVFLGLGLPFVVGSIYWEYLADVTQPFSYPAGSLSFSVLTFTLCAILAIGHLYSRRVQYGGELGGPSGPKLASAIFLCSLWFFYIGLSIWRIKSGADGAVVEKWEEYLAFPIGLVHLAIFIAIINGVVSALGVGQEDDDDAENVEADEGRKVSFLAEMEARGRKKEERKINKILEMLGVSMGDDDAAPAGGKGEKTKATMTKQAVRASVNAVNKGKGLGKGGHHRRQGAPDSSASGRGAVERSRSTSRESAAQNKRNKKGAATTSPKHSSRDSPKDHHHAAGGKRTSKGAAVEPVNESSQERESRSTANSIGKGEKSAPTTTAAETTRSTESMGKERPAREKGGSSNKNGAEETTRSTDSMGKERTPRGPGASSNKNGAEETTTRSTDSMGKGRPRPGPGTSRPYGASTTRNAPAKGHLEPATPRTKEAAVRSTKGKGKKGPGA